MALVPENTTFVGVERRIDGIRDWYPAAYVTLKLGGDAPKVNISPSTARTLAKQLVTFANYIDPPTPRKPRAKS